MGGTTRTTGKTIHSTPGALSSLAKEERGEKRLLAFGGAKLRRPPSSSGTPWPRRGGGMKHAA